MVANIWRRLSGAGSGRTLQIQAMTTLRRSSGGAMLGFLIGGVLLLPIARTYGRLVRDIPDAGAEVAYAEAVFRPFAGFGIGWVMVLAYAIVCPWEVVAIGNLLARVFSRHQALWAGAAGSPGTRRDSLQLRHTDRRNRVDGVVHRGGGVPG